MAEYSVGSIMAEVRLRDWPAGKVAQMKLAIQRLEEAVNFTIAAQVKQGTARIFSTRVPKITDFNVAPGFRSFQLDFTTPKGIVDLLLYEVQHDTSGAFPSPTTLTFTDTHVVLAGDPTVEETRFFRIRVINSKFEAGPWSDIESATSTPFKIVINRNAQVEVTIVPANYDEWVDIATKSYVSTGGPISISAHVGTDLERDDFGVRGGTIEWRILRDDMEIPGAGIARTAGAGANVNIVDYASLITPFEDLAQGTYEYKVQAFVIDSETDFDDVDAMVDIFDLIEVVKVTVPTPPAADPC